MVKMKKYLSYKFLPAYLLGPHVSIPFPDASAILKLLQTALQAKLELKTVIEIL